MPDWYNQVQVGGDLPEEYGDFYPPPGRQRRAGGQSSESMYRAIPSFVDRAGRGQAREPSQSTGHWCDNHNVAGMAACVGWGGEQSKALMTSSASNHVAQKSLGRPQGVRHLQSKYPSRTKCAWIPCGNQPAAVMSGARRSGTCSSGTRSAVPQPAQHSTALHVPVVYQHGMELTRVGLCGQGQGWSMYQG